MRVIIEDKGTLVVQQREIPTQLYPGQIYVKVHAISVSPFDIGLAYRGITSFFSDSKRKQIFGCDFSGTIASVGDQVTRFKLGDEIFGIVKNPISDGSASEYISVDESVCALKPLNLSHAEAVSLVWDSMVAERALRLAKPRDTDSVLITGGSTNMARIITQIAKSSMFYLEWIASTVSLASDREYSESFGVDETFDISCNSGDWSSQFDHGINKKSYEIVIDITGESKQVKKLLNRKTGRYISLESKPVPDEILLLVDNDRKNLKSRYRFLLSSKLASITTGSLGRSVYSHNNYYTPIPTSDGEILERLSILMETLILTPIVETIFKPESAQEAAEFVQRNWKRMRGKVVILFVE